VLVTDSRIVKEAEDFTITTTDGYTRNLYNTLDSGKTVFVDLFFTTCTYCQLHAPVIEEIYQNHGAGQGNIEFWGISNNLFDTNHLIDEYKETYNITNPCAGFQGGGTTAHSIVIEGQNFLGWPTYVVICPDRTMYFDPVYPPTVTGFDPYFESCAATIGVEEGKGNSDKCIVSVYPNPASSEIYLEMNPVAVGQATVEVYDLLGVKIHFQNLQISPGTKTYTIPVDHLSSGNYFLRYLQDNKLMETHKIMISRDRF
jgi:thiol-disulfide isomerase/thioredoxin